MKKLKLVQGIGLEVCEDCGDSDCGIEPDECVRTENAILLLDEYIEEHPKTS